MANNDPKIRTPHQAAAHYLDMRVLHSGRAATASAASAAAAASSASVSSNRASDNTPPHIRNAANEKFPRRSTIVKAEPDQQTKPTPPRLGGS